MFATLATIDKRIRQLNETVTDGFSYTLFALETLQESALEEGGGGSGDGKLDSSLIVDNSTSFNFQWFDQIKNATNETLQESVVGEGVATGKSEPSLIVDNSTNFNFEWFDQLKNNTND